MTWKLRLYSSNVNFKADTCKKNLAKTIYLHPLAQFTHGVPVDKSCAVIKGQGHVKAYRINSVLTYCWGRQQGFHI